MRGTNDEGDPLGDGEGTGDVMSSSSGVSLIPTTMCAGSRVECTCAPA